MLPLFALVSLIIFACNKNDHPAISGQPSSKATLLMNATNDMVQASTLESEDVADIVGSADSSACPVVTFAPSRNDYPHTKTLDYGSGCMGADSVTRQGIKVITFYMNPDSASIGTLISEVTYNNFSVNGISMTGTVDTYIDSSSTNTMRILKVVSVKTLTGTNGDSKLFSSTNYWKQTQGGNTATHKDDVFQVTGSAYGTETLDGATQVEWTSTINANKPVIKPADCNHRTKGEVDANLTVITGGTSNFTEVLDYGNGDCDNIATLSINGGTPQQVTLPLYFWPLSL